MKGRDSCGQTPKPENVSYYSYYVYVAKLIVQSCLVCLSLTYFCLFHVPSRLIPTRLYLRTQSILGFTRQPITFPLGQILADLCLHILRLILLILHRIHILHVTQHHIWCCSFRDPLRQPVPMLTTSSLTVIYLTMSRQAINCSTFVLRTSDY